MRYYKTGTFIAYPEAMKRIGGNKEPPQQ